MKKRMLVWVICIALLVPILTVTAHADCAPKPGVEVDVICARNVIVTLLGQGEGSGPNEAIGPGELPEEWRKLESDWEMAAWERFRDYQDPDGFRFWGNMDWHGIDWGYYPPETFKIAVYFPDTDVLIVSRDVYEAYAFQSDFRVWLERTDYADGEIVAMNTKKDFDWMEEIWGFLSRVLITLALELTVARLFGYGEKRHTKTILSVNLVTQVGLNVLLTLWYILDGPFDAMLRLVLAEIVVLVIESLLYARRLPEPGQKKGKTVLYAIAANLISVLVGWVLID